MDSQGIPECETIAGSEIRGTDRRTADQAILDLVEYCFTNNAEDASRAFEIGLLALIPKNITSYCDILLLETIYKLALTIVTFRLSNGIEFHNPVHGGSKQRGEREQ